MIHGGPRACLDGASALVAGGLVRFEVDRVRVSVPAASGSATIHASTSGRRDGGPRPTSSAPGSRGPDRRSPPCELRCGAHGPRATYVLVLTVQQGLTTPQAVGEELLRVRQDARCRCSSHSVVNELLDGARSLGELDVTGSCAGAGYRFPTVRCCAAIVRTATTLDLYWADYRLVLGSTGSTHVGRQRGRRRPPAERPGARRRHGPPAAAARLRLRADDFFAQVEQALRDAGWRQAS